ncbi:hypothetical protein I4I80_02940 [Pseudomonas syringae pv. tomato]|nr:hypothetical protein [Pseudomonas syringae pv. tomato]MBW8023702.1 hypothetical protein [Pseudomonas syringae pv. tomato]
MARIKDGHSKILVILALIPLLASGYWFIKQIVDSRTLISHRSAGELKISNNNFVKTTTDEFSVQGGDFVFVPERTEKMELRTYANGIQKLCLLPFNERYSQQCRFVSPQSAAGDI